MMGASLFVAKNLLLLSLLPLPTSIGFAPSSWAQPRSDSWQGNRWHYHNENTIISRRASSYDDPNEGETPEERRARMELVRKIQSSFYRDDDAKATSGSPYVDDIEAVNDKWLQRDLANNPSIMTNLPLWRVQWTELPGYQNVLNVHVPHYTHMFRKLMLQHPRPWYYGHVYLPDGSENINNPDYFYKQAGVDEELIPSYETSKATLVGTLMQITDYVVQDDGRLTLIVQGVGRINVLEASQHVPYAIANVELVPDQESWERHLWPLVGSTPTDSAELSKALVDATQDVAVMEDEAYRGLEYHGTTFGGDDNSLPEVSPLSNVNGTVRMVGLERGEAERTFAAGLRRRGNELGSDEVLLASSTLKSLEYTTINSGGGNTLQRAGSDVRDSTINRQRVNSTA